MPRILPELAATAKPEVLADFVELGEFAKSIGKTRQTVYRWTHQDGFPSAKIGNKQLVYIPAAREWLISKVTRPTTSASA